MTKSECQQETIQHIVNVQKYIKDLTDQLLDRGVKHDSSKLQSPELEIFVEYTPKLAASEYGSDEYKQFLKEMQPALTHHYGANRHHPEHFQNGINGMNILDIVEMLCDWKAATLRHNDGDLLKSIEINQKRFGYDDQLKEIFLNTAPILYKYQVKWDGVWGNPVKDKGAPKRLYGFCLGDTVEQIHAKIDANEDFSDIMKEYLKFGVNDEFREKDYTNKLFQLDDAMIQWIVN